MKSDYVIRNGFLEHDNGTSAITNGVWKLAKDARSASGLAFATRSWNGRGDHTDIMEIPKPFVTWPQPQRELSWELVGIAMHNAGSDSAGELMRALVENASNPKARWMVWDARKDQILMDWEWLDRATDYMRYERKQGRSVVVLPSTPVTPIPAW